MFPTSSVHGERSTPDPTLSLERTANLSCLRVFDARGIAAVVFGPGRAQMTCKGIPAKPLCEGHL